MKRKQIIYKKKLFCQNPYIKTIGCHSTRSHTRWRHNHREVQLLGFLSNLYPSVAYRSNRIAPPSDCVFTLYLVHVRAAAISSLFRRHQFIYMQYRLFSKYSNRCKITMKPKGANFVSQFAIATLNFLSHSSWRLNGGMCAHRSSSQMHIYLFVLRR